MVRLSLILISLFSATVDSKQLRSQQRELHDEMQFNEQEYLLELSERFAEKQKVQIFGSNHSLKPQQVFHHHHMKTGGTSLDDQLECARKRLKILGGISSKYYELHECDDEEYKKCLAVTKAGKKCRAEVDSSSILSYCAPLSDLHKFGWSLDDNIFAEERRVASFTVLRNPIDRVWSMYRFSTKGCYDCRELIDIYRAVDARNVTLGLDQSCIEQLSNHQVRNLISDPSLPQETWLNQAKRNLQKQFTLIGLTEQLPETHKMLSTILPWLSENYHNNGASSGKSKPCELPHSNASPRNNGCGPNYTHKKIPRKPDKNTRRLIEKHNQLDTKLYEYAVQLFELQRRAFENRDGESVGR